MPSCSVPSEFTRLGNTDHNGALNPISEPLKYGTAGFRCDARKLAFVTFRMGALAAVRSLDRSASAIGLMITASHNPPVDNGVKLVDPDGAMLEGSWEPTATLLVNSLDDDFPRVFAELSATKSQSDEGAEATVFIGRDTRDSSTHLAQAAIAGVKWAGGRAVDYGMLTTPQLHYVVRCHNDSVYGLATEADYYRKYSHSFLSLINRFQAKGAAKKYTASISVDAANGIGGLKLTEMVKHLDGKLALNIQNTHGRLNSECGADFVKLTRQFPNGFEIDQLQKCCSFDGDADRIVYFYKDKGGVCRLLDGDKIALLLAEFLLSQLPTETEQRWKLGVVQTAYANGASTRYIAQKLNIPTKFVPTGVKNLHHEALNYDIGIYFEANGHGTIVYSDRFKAFLNQTEDAKMEILRDFVNLTNETVGDAMSDMLLVESILRYKDWTIQDWDAVYEDMPSRQKKVQVSDRSLVTTTWDETRATAPSGLQDQIDRLVAKCGHGGRAFVRPSGTEDIVRVYAEAKTQEMADKLADDIEAVVKKLCN